MKRTAWIAFLLLCVFLVALDAWAGPPRDVVKISEETVTEEEITASNTPGRCRDTRGRFVKCQPTKAEAAAEEEQPPTVDVTLTGGMVVSMGNENADTGLKPYVSVEAAFPLSKWKLTPRAIIAAELTGAPDTNVVSIEDPTTFNALDARAIVSQVIHPSVYVAPFCEAGFGTYVAGGPGREGRGMKHWGCGLSAGGLSTRGQVYVWGGQDQRLTGTWRVVVGSRGSLKLYDSKEQKGLLKGKVMRLNVEAIHATREFNDARGLPLRDMVAKVALAVGL